LRLAYALTGGAPSLLERCRLNLTNRSISVSFAAGSEDGIGLGEAVTRRIESLAKHLGRIAA
ncbi:MAG: Ppx/GppA family phosphatase, partial [Elsteraceae bacterium]